MNTYQFNMLSRDDLYDLAQEIVDMYQHTWETRFERELLEETPIERLITDLVLTIKVMDLIMSLN